VELGLNNPQWILSLLAQPAERRAQRIGLCPVHDKVDTNVERAPKDPTAGGNPVPLDKRAARTILNRALQGRL
jgi:alcohol dehydrogenase class IV